ncbi:hypothetical protein TNCV_4742211 [Trichonephila clavipes]|nr:hypothetical protein TNCV_4742211 [Trichonephila clavipes]
MSKEPCVKTVRPVNSGVIILEHETFAWKESLKHRVKMICENAFIMAACDHPHPLKTTRGINPQDIAYHNISEPAPCFTVGTMQSTCSDGLCRNSEFWNSYFEMNARSMQLPLDSFHGYGVLKVSIHLGRYLLAFWGDYPLQHSSVMVLQLLFKKI